MRMELVKRNDSRHAKWSNEGILGARATLSPSNFKGGFHQTHIGR